MIEPVRTIAVSGPSATITDPTIGSARDVGLWADDEADYDAFIGDTPFVGDSE